MSRRSRAPKDPLANLSAGVKLGLERLVADSAPEVASMLDKDKDVPVSDLVIACAAVMQQQQLSAESFLGRFFNVSLLSAHADVLGKSAKGNEATLAARIAREWQRPGFSIPDESGHGPDEDAAPAKRRKTDTPST